MCWEWQGEGKECSGQMEKHVQQPSQEGTGYACGKESEYGWSRGDKGDAVQSTAEGPDHTEPYRPLRIIAYPESNGKFEVGSVMRGTDMKGWGGQGSGKEEEWNQLGGYHKVQARDHCSLIMMVVVETKGKGQIRDCAEGQRDRVC